MTPPGATRFSAALMTNVRAGVVTAVRRAGCISTRRGTEGERHEDHSEQDANRARHRASTNFFGVRVGAAAAPLKSRLVSAVVRAVSRHWGAFLRHLCSF